MICFLLRLAYFMLFTVAGCQPVAKKNGLSEQMREFKPRQQLEQGDDSDDCGFSTGYKARHRIIERMYEFKRIKASVDVVDETLGEVLIELSLATKIPILYDDSVSSISVSLTLSDKPLLDILSILTSNSAIDFSFIEEGQYFWIGSINGEKSKGREMEYLPAIATIHHYTFISSFVKPSEILNLMPTMYKKYVMGSDESGLVLIDAPLKIINKIIDIAGDIDRPKKQIIADLQIFTITKNGKDTYGKAIESANLSNIYDVFAPINPAFTPAILKPETYRAFLSGFDLLSESGLIESVAKPTLITEEGKSAEYKTSSTFFVPQLNTYDRERTIAIATGIKFTPYVAEGNNIVLEIHEAYAGSAEVDLLRQNSHRIQTNVTLRPNDSIMLGGFIGSKKREVIKKVPLLGDIPYLGWLFKHKSFTHEQVETIFILTPRLVCQKLHY